MNNKMQRSNLKIGGIHFGIVVGLMYQCGGISVEHWVVIEFLYPKHKCNFNSSQSVTNLKVDRLWTVQGTYMCVQGIQRVKCTVQLSLHTCYYTTIFLCISLEDLYASPPHNRQDFTPQQNSTRWFDTNDSRSHDIAHRSASGSVTKAGWWIASKGGRGDSTLGGSIHTPNIWTKGS